MNRFPSAGSGERDAQNNTENTGDNLYFDTAKCRGRIVAETFWVSGSTALHFKLICRSGRLLE
jgi:hypothetical protein